MCSMCWMLRRSLGPCRGGEWGIYRPSYSRHSTTRDGAVPPRWMQLWAIRISTLLNPSLVFRLGKMKLLALEVMVRRSRWPLKNVWDSLVVRMRTG